MKQVIIALFFLLPVPSAWAQPREATLHVATRLVKPFVFEEGGQLTGFSVELWQEISRQMNTRSEFLVKPTVQELIRSIKSKEAELGIAAISITAEREAELDFSQPMFDAGLQILIPASGSEGNMMTGIVSAIFNSSFGPILGLVLLTVVVTGHLVWFFERHRPNGMLSSDSYFPGIFEACWWSAATLATQADQMPRSAVARVVAVIWMFTAVVFIAYFTAAVTSSLTVQQLRGDIKGPEDLPGKRVATVTGSTSAEYLKHHGIPAKEFTRVEDACEALQQAAVDAVVYDAPVLLYYVSHEAKGKVQVVGRIFRKESYGILFPSNSSKRKLVNETLLKLKENGTYDRLYTKWFGGNGS
jgi:polar amino acid transport system substrate-binding protein